MDRAARLSARLGLCTAADGERLTTCLSNFGLPTHLKESLTARTLLDYVKRDKKKSGDSVKFVVLNAIGEAALQPLRFSELAEHLRSLL